jgi:hypothetical protein
MLTDTSTRPRPSGAPMLPPALAFAVLTVLGLVLGGAGPRPTTSPADVAAYLAAHGTVATVLAAAVFASSIPLAVFSAVAYRRQRTLGITLPGPVIGLAGGLLAAAALALSGLVGWTAATSAGLADAALLRALTTLSFAAGGPGFVPPFALLIAGVAVPSLLAGLLPRWLAAAGIGVAALGMLSVFSLLTPVLYPLLPIGRFGGLLFILATAALLPRTPRGTQ